LTSSITSSLAAGRFQAPRQLRRIHRLDGTNNSAALVRLVGLQMADQVKPRARQIAHGGRFAGEFLHVVFAEFAQAQA
jgi:hypothetical protein